MKMQRLLGIFCVSVLAMILAAMPAEAKSKGIGEAASECAKEANPQAKDECVRAAQEARGKGERGKSDKKRKKDDDDDKDDKDDDHKKGKKDKKDKKDKKNKKDKKGKKPKKD